MDIIINRNTHNQFVNFSANKQNSNIAEKMTLNNVSKPKTNPNVYYGKDLVVNKNYETPIPEDLKVLFNELQTKEGKDFAETAYKGLLKHYNLEKVAPENLYWDTTCKKSDLDIVSDYMWYDNKITLYEDNFLHSGKTKEEQLGFIAHEVTHMRQLVNIMQTEDLPLTSVATAFAIFDFNSNLSKNPMMQQQFIKARQNGKEKEFSMYIIGQMARKNYGELSKSFKDAMSLPKHPLNSPNGQKALRDLDSWSKYSSRDWNTYINVLVEKEAMDEENKMREMYRNYTKK